MYLKLGKKASIFHDQTSGLLLRNGEVIEYNKTQTKRIVSALQGGAIVEIQESEYNALKQKWDATNPVAAAQKRKKIQEAVKSEPKKDNADEEDTDEGTDTEDTGEDSSGKEALKKKLLAMSHENLLAYYKENFQVGDEEEKDFVKLKTVKAKVEFLLEDED
jgi:hypothetical protein